MPDRGAARAPRRSAAPPAAGNGGARHQAPPAPPVVRLRPPPAASTPVAAPTPGQPLPGSVAGRISSSLGVDVSSVRVHGDASSASAASALGARAFAYGSSVFLGSGERPTDLPLMAHEVTHVVQQRGAPALQLWNGASTDRYEREAHRASAAVSRGESFSVRERAPAGIQRWGLGDVLDYFADKANLIPGFRMFTIVLGVNPINMSSVPRTAANILRALVELIPGGGLITRALDSYGIFDRVGAWVEGQLRSLGIVAGSIKAAISEFLGSLGLSDIFHLGSVWERAKRIFTEPIRRIVDFATSLVAQIVAFIKEAILKPLAELAARTPGYDLLKAVLGQDPITGEAVPRNADTLIGGFMKMIGQEEVWNNLKRARAVERAWAWFQGALGGLLGFVRQIPGMFLAALRSLTIEDIVLLPQAFVKVARAFGGFLVRFATWAGEQVLGLLQIIFEVVAPGAMPYLRKAAGAFRQIVRNPVGFIGNLVRAGVQGFRQFGANFLGHLRKSLIDWLTGTLSGAGVYIPQAFELREIIKFVLSVLGLTWANVRGKLVKLIPEPIVRALETGFDIVVTLVREGPAAAWDKIREQISNLKEMVMEQIMTFVRDRIVQAAITRLVTSLNPAGAFIQAVIAIYNTVMFFVERLKQIAQVVASFIDSISAIASGAVGAAANRVEQTMGGLLTLVISFLARLVGLGRVSDAVKNIVDRIRAPIDRALDRVVAWIVSVASRLGRRPGAPDSRTPEQKMQALDAAVAEVEALAGSKPDRPALERRLGAIKSKHQLSSLFFETLEGGAFRVVAEINPRKPGKTYPPGETKYTIIENGARVLRPQYRGAGPIRRRLYSSSNRSATQRIIRKFVTPLIRQRNPRTSAWELAPDFDSALFWEPSPGQVVGLRDARTRPTLAHDMSVVTHWNTIGYDGDQPTRIAFYHFQGREDDARVLMFSLNREEGTGAEGDAAKYTPTVGPRFKEPGE